MKYKDHPFYLFWGNIWILLECFIEENTREVIDKLAEMVRKNNE